MTYIIDKILNCVRCIYSFEIVDLFVVLKMFYLNILNLNSMLCVCLFEFVLCMFMPEWLYKYLYVI